MNAGAWVTVLALPALLASTWRKWRAGEWLFKPLAAAGFVLSALQHGGARSAYGLCVTAGLALSWCGDVLLLGKSKRPFLAGLGFFLLAHVAYSAAFVVRGVAPLATLLALALAAGPLALVARWLLPRVPAAMRAPVAAYAVVITAMVALAAGAAARRPDALLVAGAVGFYLSDLAVARERFVAPGFVNKLWGLPLYFLAQLALAATVAR